MSAYYAPLAGGILIGLATAMLLLVNGRIAGISGIVGGLLSRAFPGQATEGDAAWRFAFLGGLVAAPLVYGALAALPSVQVDAGTLTLAAAGLLVGVGTRYGSGCTSGHGVCGLSRLSPRSLVATLCFMAAGFATVAVVRSFA
ncbi:YeeE/YedE family protein [Pseudoduganella sp. R-43]|uniref:YeeE/YedE family protein n=1 Tax=Pseudoduganella sp. R-43 TaxID=3404063 RepID=UPI003CEC39EB